jgi:hypothetical protein
VLSGAFVAAFFYVISFYGLGMIFPVVRLALGATVEDLSTMSDPLLWLLAVLAWITTHGIGFLHTVKLPQPAEPPIPHRPMQVPFALRVFVITLLFLLAVSLAVLIVMLQLGLLEHCSIQRFVAASDTLNCTRSYRLNYNVKHLCVDEIAPTWSISHTLSATMTIRHRTNHQKP